MKLYYARGACSLAPHIALREAGVVFELVQVDLRTKKTAGGSDYLQVNPKGYVPALQLADGGVLTEAAVVLQYIADQKPDAGLMPRAGSMERYRTMEWLNFVAAEIHKTLGALFKPNLTPEWKQSSLALFGNRCDILAGALAGRPFLTDAGFSVADIYLYTVLSWTKFLQVDLGKWPALTEYVSRVAARPAVREALKAEGLLK
jgi:glutathione S-transferase